MALEFNTIGVQLKWASETVAGSRPTSGFVALPDIKSIPAMDLNPSKLEVTNLIDTNKRYIPGVRDAGDDFPINGNLTASLKTAWGSVVSIAKAAWASGFATWFEVAVPNFDSFYFAGTPVELGMNEMAVDAVAEATLHIIPDKIAGWATKSST